MAEYWDGGDVKNLLCYTYIIKVKNDNTRFSGWIKGYNLADAENNLADQYPDIDKTIKLTQSGTWEYFISQGDKLGWD